MAKIRKTTMTGLMTIRTAPAVGVRRGRVRALRRAGAEIRSESESEPTKTSLHAPCQWCCADWRPMGARPRQIHLHSRLHHSQLANSTTTTTTAERRCQYYTDATRAAAVSRLRRRRRETSAAAAPLKHPHSHRRCQFPSCFHRHCWNSGRQQLPRRRVSHCWSPPQDAPCAAPRVLQCDAIRSIARQAIASDQRRAAAAPALDECFRVERMCVCGCSGEFCGSVGAIGDG